MSTESVANFTPLPPSPLRSAGPGLQESLHHYAMRMASSCCMPLRKLEEFLLRDSARPGRGGNAILPSSWIGPRSNFQALLAALKRDTGVANLHIGTFHIVAGVIGAGGMRRRHDRGGGRAWCPMCYQQWDPKTSSEPLIWAFDMLSACPLHNVLMETRCPKCNSRQEFSAPFRKRTACQHCATPLGHPNSRSEEDLQNRWVNGALLKLMQWLEETDTPINGKGYERFVEFMRARSGLPQVIRTYLYTRTYTSQRQLSLPTVTSLLNLAAFQGTEISTILCEPAFAASENLTEGRRSFEGLLFRARDLRESHRRAAVVLDQLARGGKLIPPVSVVWLEFGHWVDASRDVCPLEQRRYVDVFMRQTLSLSRQRFKAGVLRCMRLLEKHPDERDPQKLLRRTLVTEYGHQAAGAKECAEASINLWHTIKRCSADQLAHHEEKKASVLAGWARGDEAPAAPSATERALAPVAASRERGHSGPI